MSAYRKFIVAIVVAVLLAGLVALQAALEDGAVTAYEWAGIAVAAIGALAVYAIPNEPRIDAAARVEDYTGAQGTDA